MEARESLAKWFQVRVAFISCLLALGKKMQTRADPNELVQKNIIKGLQL
jgi:hypothetical protein